MAFAAEANHLRCPVTPESQIRPVSLHICNASAERKYIREVVAMPSTKIVWEIRPSKHRHTFDLISNTLPFGRTGGYHYVAGAVRHAKAYSGSQPAVIRVYDEAGNVVETHEHAGGS
jgi:hypothetical protein